MVSRDLAEALVGVIPKTMQLIRAEVRRSSDALSLTQFRILSRLLEYPRTNAELALELGVSDPAMSRQIQSMVEAGWIDRVCAKHDRRSNRLSATRAGEKVFLALRERVVSDFERRIEALDEIERQDLRAGLEVIGAMVSENPAREAAPAAASTEAHPA